MLNADVSPPSIYKNRFTPNFLIDIFYCNEIFVENIPPPLSSYVWEFFAPIAALINSVSPRRCK